MPNLKTHRSNEVSLLKRIKLITASLVLAAAAFSFAQESVQVPEPLIITSAGQSADAALVEVVLRRTGITSTLSELLDQEDLAASGARSLIIVLGGSQKGLGAAGINTDEEVARVESLMDWAEANGLVMVGVHVGGEGRRGPLSERFIVDTAPRMNLLIVTAEGNADGYFTGVAEAGGIPFVELTDTFQVGPTLQEYLVSE